MKAILVVLGAVKKHTPSWCHLGNSNNGHLILAPQKEGVFSRGLDSMVYTRICGKYRVIARLGTLLTNLFIGGEQTQFGNVLLSLFDNCPTPGSLHQMCKYEVHIIN